MRAVRPAACLGALLSLLAAACGDERVEIIGGLAGDTVDRSPCPPSLAGRLTVMAVPVERNIAWQKPGYDLFPTDERVALAVQPNGQAQIAWMEMSPLTVAGVALQDPQGVHVTPLDASLHRRGADSILATALEVSGLVAHDDGFAVLTRDANPGRAIAISDDNTVAFLVRFQNGVAQWREPLTGSASLDAEQTGTVYSPFLEGQLVWSDSIYGAHFAVRAGMGDQHEGYWRDALVFRDSLLRPAIWPVARGCDDNGGIRLVPDPGKANLVKATLPTLPQMTGLCVQQAKQAVKFTSLENDRVVSDQEVEWSGYSGARLGSVVKTPTGYLVFWLSLGAENDGRGHDIRMARLDANFNLTSGPTWFARTPGREEWNLHVAPYGPDGTRFLMMYGEIEISGSAFDNDAMFTGPFRGTHLVLLDANGAPVSSDELVQGAPTTANAEPVVLADGAIAWPFVNPNPDYTAPILGPNGPGQTSLRIARVRYCK